MKLPEFQQCIFRWGWMAEEQRQFIFVFTGKYSARGTALKFGEAVQLPALNWNSSLASQKSWLKQELQKLNWIFLTPVCNSFLLANAHLTLYEFGMSSEIQSWSIPVCRYLKNDCKVLVLTQAEQKCISKPWNRLQWKLASPYAPVLIQYATSL